MKKIIATMALAALALTGCIKGSDGVSEEYRRVQGGIMIYNSVTAMQNVAMQPANAGIRLAILLAEAEKQIAASETPDAPITADYLKNLTVKIYGATSDIKLQAMLFGDLTTIEKTSDGWKINYGGSQQQADGFILSGSLQVITGDADQLMDATGEASAWKVMMLEGFGVSSYSSYGSTTADFVMGTSDLQNPMANMTLLSYNGDGSYSISLAGIQAWFKGSEQFKSNWSSALTLTPGSDNGSLAISDTESDSGDEIKDFKVSGTASGDSFYATASELGSLRFSYRLTDGQYRRIIKSSSISSGYGAYAQIVSGTQKCSITSPAGDYSIETYPSPDVEYVWTLSGNYLSVSVKYNGFVYSN